MPQQFQVLRCYKCSAFQGHQTTKSKKWECKLCGEKQSFKRFYGIGTAKECRLQVQKLNSLRGQCDEAKNNKDQNINFSESDEIVKIPVKNNYTPVEKSKWSNYIDETEIVEENNLEDMHLGETEVVLEIPMKRKKKSTNSFEGNPVFTTTNSKDHTTPSEIVPNSLILRKVSEPNTSQSSFDIGNTLSGQELINKIINNKFNKFVPPPTNKDSKWAQFTDEPHIENIDNQCKNSKLTPQNEKFSWSDDTDIEAILDI